MAASLLAMVCGITAGSKKHAGSKPILQQHRDAFRALSEDLVRLAAEDANAYDSVVESMKKRKASPGPITDNAVQKALSYAAEVPMSTMAKCLKLLEASAIVAKMGVRSASSDVGVAILLAEAGFRGAAMNVRINLNGISDKAFSASVEADIKTQEERASEAARKALSLLET
jgi:formiminotetrahydrofolate cyclodeaminase